MSEFMWMRSRTPDGRWFGITWSHTPALDDIDYLLRVLTVAREGYAPKKPLPKHIEGIPIVKCEWHEFEAA